jgi:hypothetical protein
MKNFTKLAAIALLVAGSIACEGEGSHHDPVTTTTETTATVPAATETDPAITATTVTETSATSATTTDATATDTTATTPPPAPQQ